MVAAVLVHQQTIIAEGIHQQSGAPHAEVNCLAAYDQLKEKPALDECVLYINLEPCSHTGKTPPCADLLITRGIRHVVIGMEDPNPLVAGKGIARLKAAGIEITGPVCENEARILNKRFITFHEKKRPYIILKWAQSADGFIGLPEKRVTISGVMAHQLSHQWRTQEQAILVGTHTIRTDAPQLTPRLVSGPQPLRVGIDRKRNTNWPQDTTIPTLIFTESPAPARNNVVYSTLDFSSPLLPQMMETLYQRQVQSVLVEGGANLLQQFIDWEWDEARVFRSSQIILNHGIPAPQLPVHSRIIVTQHIDTDSLTVYSKA